MLQDTYEVACDIVHRPARLDVIGMGGGTETAKVWHNEVIIILGRSCGMCYSGGKNVERGDRVRGCGERRGLHTLNSSICFDQVLQRLGQPCAMIIVVSASGLNST